jgi:hypothetical protein
VTVEVKLEVGFKLGVRVMEGCMGFNPKISEPIRTSSSHDPM